MVPAGPDTDRNPSEDPQQRLDRHDGRAPWRPASAMSSPAAQVLPGGAGSSSSAALSSRDPEPPRPNWARTKMNDEYFQAPDSAHKHARRCQSPCFCYTISGEEKQVVRTNLGGPGGGLIAAARSV